MEKKLPVYKITIGDNDETGVSRISLVEKPAIEVNYVAFNKEFKFSAIVEQKKLAGPFLVPDQMIYRYNEKMGEYYVTFDKETIQRIADKFNKGSNTHSINFEHSDKMVQAFVAENWITEGKDKSSKWNYDLKDGSWFGIVKIEDDQFWKDYVKTGEVLGFSVEGWLGMSLESLSEQIEMAKKVNINILPPCHPNCKCEVNNDTWTFSSDENSPCDICIEKKKKYDLFKKRKKSKFMEEKFVEAILVDGSKINADADILDVGVEVYSVAEDGTKTPVADGEYQLQSGDVLVIKESKIESITPAEAEVEVEQAEEVAVEKMAVDQSILDEIQNAVTPLIDRIVKLEESIMVKQTENAQLSKEIEKFSLIAGVESGTIPVELKEVKNNSTLEFKKEENRKMESAIERIRSIAKNK